MFTCFPAYFSGGSTSGYPDRAPAGILGRRGEGSGEGGVHFVATQLSLSSRVTVMLMALRIVSGLIASLLIYLASPTYVYQL